MLLSNLLEVKNLSIQFQTNHGVAHAVRSVNLSLEKGKTLGIIGESGSGKSVTAKSIIRLIENQNGKITSGYIHFKGDDLIKKSIKDMRKIRGNSISMIFQDPMTSLNPLIKVGEQISEVMRFHKKMNKKDAKNEAIQIMKDLSIPSAKDRYNQYPHEFSGGMLQRLMIAIALACKPQMLIADEPTTALDVTIQAQILRLLKGLQQENEMAMLLITHDFGVVAEVCDNVSVMYAGEIVESTDVNRIFETPLHPYTLGLMESRPKLGSSQQKLNSIEGNPPNLMEKIQGCPFASRCKFRTEICDEQKPKFEELLPKHWVACHHAKELTEERGKEYATTSES